MNLSAVEPFKKILDASSADHQIHAGVMFKGDFKSAVEIFGDFCY